MIEILISFFKDFDNIDNGVYTLLKTKRAIDCASTKGRDRECFLWLRIIDNTTKIENYDSDIVNNAINDMGCAEMPYFCQGFMKKCP